MPVSHSFAQAASLPSAPSGEQEIPFNRPFIAGRELFYISHAVLSGNLAGNGRFTKLCSDWMEEVFGAKRVLLTHSCTAALEMSALLCGLGPGDEVIMPSYTFVSTANAFALRGARIRFVDIRPDTLNIDETKIEEAITDRTKAIVPVHYAGVAAEMDVINEVALRHGVTVIEDAAQGVNATYHDRCLGTLGAIGAYSFHETKNLISGEGGALVLNDESLVERAEIIRDKGTNRSQFFRGLVDKYTWVGLGSSYLASELTAAFLYGQLEAVERITRERLAIFEYYRQGLEPLAERGLLRLPICPAWCGHNAHMFYVLLPTAEQRDGLLDYLKARNIHAVIHYVALHSSPMGRRMSSVPDVELPVTQDASERLLRLPCYFDLRIEDQDRVIHAMEDYLTGSGRA